VRWDYALLARNNLTGRSAVRPGRERICAAGPDRIGKVYLKTVYREYTDATFTRLKPRPPKWQHLGVLGSVLQAEVGDTIVVHFKNQTRFAMSVHP